VDPTLTLLGSLEDIYEAERVLAIKHQFASAEHSTGPGTRRHYNAHLEHAEALFLAIQEPELPPRSVPLSVGEHMLGRHARCQNIIRDPYTSRFHCLISVHIDGHVTVRDLTSMSGTWINGVRISVEEKLNLQIGDCIQIGRSILHLLPE
jgi:hypothetical protein